MGGSRVEKIGELSIIGLGKGLTFLFIRGFQMAYGVISLIGEKRVTR